VDCPDPTGCCYLKSELSYKKKAGYWGTLKSKCDIPKVFYDKTIEYIKKNFKEVDFIFLLGDNYGHTYFRD